MTSLLKHMYPRFPSRSHESISGCIGGDPSFVGVNQGDLCGFERVSLRFSRPFQQQVFSRSFGAVDHKGHPRLRAFNGYGLVPPLACHGVVPLDAELEFGGFVPGRAA